MDRKKRASVKRYITLGLTALVTAGLASLPMLTAKTMEEGTKASTLTAVVQTSTLERVLMGGGALSARDQVDVTIPTGVKVTALLAANGDTVAAGQALAAVDQVSVRTAIRDAQEALNEVTAKLAAARNQIAPGLLTVDEEGNLYSDGKKVEKNKLESYAQFLSLADQHREYEEILLDLFRINRLGTINAPSAGMIDGLDRSIVQKVAFDGEQLQLFLLSDSEEGEEPPKPVVYDCFAAKVVTVSGPQMAVLRGTAFQVESLDDLPAVEAESLTELALIPNLPVYNTLQEEWEAHMPATGDVLVVVTDPEGNTFGLLRQGDTPVNPEEEDDREALDALAGMAGFGSGGGGGGGFGGSRTQTEPELYSTASTKLCTLVPQEIMELTVSIDELDIAAISPGMTAQITLDALKGQQFEGTVTKVSKFGANNGGSSKFDVVLELPYHEGMLPGMNGSARMTLGRIEQVLTIPVAALIEQGNKTLVYTGYDPKENILLNPVEVETGFSDGESVEIKSGLAEGMPLWYSYYDVLEISNAAKAAPGMFG